MARLSEVPVWYVGSPRMAQQARNFVNREFFRILSPNPVPRPRTLSLARIGIDALADPDFLAVEVDIEVLNAAGKLSRGWSNGGQPGRNPGGAIG
jgi:hypothetical protein